MKLLSRHHKGALEFPLKELKAVPMNITSTATKLSHVSKLSCHKNSKTTYAAVVAKISTSFADVNITSTLANAAVKKAVIPSRHPMLCTAFKTTMQTTGTRDARIPMKYLVFLASVFSPYSIMGPVSGSPGRDRL
jgi:hypothetical protein